MAKYRCHNCDDLVFKAKTSVLEHVWTKHRIEVTRLWQPVTRAEDARFPLTKTGKRKASGFLCENCKMSFSKLPPLLRHLGSTHGVCIWYEKGLTKRRVFLDGISDQTDEMRLKREFAKMPSEHIPLSQRPREPRKAQSDALPEKADRREKARTVWQELARKRIRKRTTLNDYS